MSTDYGKLIARVRDESTCTDALHRDLADAVEVLVAENDLIYESWKAASEAADEYMAELVKAERERETLRAECDQLRVNRVKERGVLVASIKRAEAERDALRALIASNHAAYLQAIGVEVEGDKSNE
jgi:hypothetical protein